jgi:hypothetical protein
MSRIACIVLALLPALAAGCGDKTVDLPKTYPASGRVVLEDGKPLAGASIQLSSADTPFTISGVADDDGKFTLSTMQGNKKVSGAIPGEYEVTIYPPIPSDHRAVQPIVLPESYKVEAKENTYTFTVPEPEVSSRSLR